MACGVDSIRRRLETKAGKRWTGAYRLYTDFPSPNALVGHFAEVGRFGRDFIRPRLSEHGFTFALEEGIFRLSGYLFQLFETEQIDL